MKEWVVFYAPDGRELLAYTLEGTFEGELEATKRQLATENVFRAEDIIVKIEVRKESTKDKYTRTHLCGSVYDKKNACENLLYADKADMTAGKKPLKQYYAYCTAEGKCRSLGCVATFTGCSPKWCPKRKESEANETADVQG